MGGVESVWSAPVDQAPCGERQYSRAWIVGEHACVASGPPRCKLRSVEERRHDSGRADRSDEVGDFVVLSKVLADQDCDGEPLAELDEMEQALRYVHGFPPPHFGVQLSAEVILVNLACVQGPSMMLALADVQPGRVKALHRLGPALF